MSKIVNREFELGTMRALKNNEGQVMEKYIPRKCSVTSKVIAPNDYASVQIFVPDVDENGRLALELENESIRKFNLKEIKFANR